MIPTNPITHLLRRLIGPNELVMMFLFWSLICSLAFADIDYVEAKKVFQQAQYHFDRGQYAQAAENFERAYEITKDPIVLSSLAWALELSGEVERTIAVLQLYLPQAPEQEQEQINQRIENLKKRVPVPPIVVDSPPKLESDALLPPKIAVAVPQNPANRPPIWLRNTMFGVSAATGVVAILAGVQASLSRRKLDEICNGSFCPSEAKMYVDKDRRYSVLTDVCWSISLGTGGVGLWLRIQSDRVISVGGRF